MKEYAEDEEAQTIAIFARQRAAGALHVSQGHAADVTEDGSSEGAPEEKRGEVEDPDHVQQQMEVQQGPTTEAGSPQSAALPPGGLAAEASVVQQQAQQHFKRLEPEVTLLEETPAKALKLTDPEEPPAKSSRSSTVSFPAGTLKTTSSTSSSGRVLAASPTFASNISRVPLGEEEVEVDEECLENGEKQRRST